MDKYKIYCSPEQTLKALELGAPVDTDSNRTSFDFIEIKKGLYAIVPTVEQMLGWLRNKGIKFHFDDETNYWHISIDNEPFSIGFGFDKNKELVAVDAALEYLKKQINE